MTTKNSSMGCETHFETSLPWCIEEWVWPWACRRRSFRRRASSGERAEPNTPRICSRLLVCDSGSESESQVGNPVRNGCESRLAIRDGRIVRLTKPSDIHKPEYFERALRQVRLSRMNDDNPYQQPASDSESSPSDRFPWLVYLFYAGFSGGILACIVTYAAIGFGLSLWIAVE